MNRSTLIVSVAAAVFLCHSSPGAPSATPTSQDLIRAIDRGDEKDVAEILKKAPSLAKSTNEWGVPVLVLSTITSLDKEHPAIVEMLLKNGADPNDHAPISIALQRIVSVRELKALLDAGANPNYKSEALAQTPFMKIAQTGNLEEVQLLVEKKAEINVQDTWLRWSVLHYAAVSGNADVVKFLLKKGAKIDAVDKDGKTALQLVSSPDHAPWAKGKDYKAVIEALKAAGSIPSENVPRKNR